MTQADPPPATSIDQRHMETALRLAARGLGDTWPNPSVGCVVVNNGHVVGRGWTQSGGRPHAETEALKMAGAAAEGATAYVTLEPCSHHGKTPPCAEALIAGGVNTVVIAAGDPDPRVSGTGIEKLMAAGVTIHKGVLAKAADALNAGFFLRVKAQRPLFALKVASTLDGRISLANGESQWITGPEARGAAHLIRAHFDAVLAGSETVVKDNPQLTCRLPGYRGRPKVRLVLDRRLRTNAAHRICDTAAGPVWIFTAPGRTDPKLTGNGVEVIGVEKAGDNLAFVAGVAADLAKRGITRVLIEGGGQVAAAFLRAGLIDEIFWFRSTGLIGGDGRPAVGPLGLDQMTDIPHFTVSETLGFGHDALQVLRRGG